MTQELTHARTLADAIYDALPVPSLAHDAGAVLCVNAEGRRVLEADSGDGILGRPLAELVHPDAREAGMQRRSLLAEHGGVMFGVPVKLVSSLGNTFQARGAAAAFAYGDSTAVVVSACDAATDICVSGPRVLPPRAGADVSVAEAALDAFPLPVIAVHDFRVAYVNYSAVSLLRAKAPGDIEGRRVTDIVHPDMRSAVLTLFRGGLAERSGMRERPAKALALNGTTIHAMGTGSFLRVDGSTFGMWVVTGARCEGVTRRQ